MNMDAIHKIFRKSPKNDISVVVRDRPFERTVTMHKDSHGHLGFQFNNGKINTIVKDSSAARNGLLIDHQLLEVNGQNVVGMKDKELTAIINQAEQVVTVTIIPSFIYDHMMKKWVFPFCLSMHLFYPPAEKNNNFILFGFQLQTVDIIHSRHHGSFTSRPISSIR